MPWIHLLIAGLFEIAWALALKSTHGWTRLWPSVATIALMAVSFTFLSLALRSLPLGTAYAVWTGIGAVGTVLVGIIWLGEPATWIRGLCVAAIVGGIVGLKVSGPRVLPRPLPAERTADAGNEAPRG